MNKEVLDFVTEKTNELINADTCSDEARAAAVLWLRAAGTADEAAATRKYIAELEADIMPIDNLISFASSADGAKYFGEELASEIALHARALKKFGAEYCDCPACAACEAILKRKNEILA